jgi:hypothetical protein
MGAKNRAVGRIEQRSEGNVMMIDQEGIIDYVLKGKDYLEAIHS